jgi:predicted dehydrogenase
MGTFHARVISALEGAVLSGVSDTDEGRRQRAAEEFACREFSDYREMLREVDGVVVAVPTVMHTAVATEILKGGVPVLLEKPIAPTRAEAETLFDLAAKKKVLLQVGHVERFNGAVQEMRKVIDRPHLIEGRRMGPRSPRIQDVGVVLDIMIHDIDIVQWLVGAPVETVHAGAVRVFSGHEDVASAVLTFKGGCVASISASRCTEEKFRTLSVSQEGAYIYLDFTTQDIHIHRRAQSDSVVERGRVRYRQESIVEHLVVNKAQNPLMEEVSHFVQVVRGEARSLVSPEDVLRTMEITDTILRQIHVGG